MVQAFRSLGLPRSVKEQVRVKERQRGYDEATLVESFVILNAAGGEGADDFERLRQDPGLAEMVGHELPSPGAARQFLYAFHEDGKIEEAKQRRLPGEIAYIPEEAPPLEVGTWRDQERVGRRGAALEILRSQCGLVPTRRDDLPQRARGVEAAGPAGGALDGARPKRLRFLILNTPGRLVRHARRLVLRLAAAAEWIAAYREGLRLLALPS